MEEEKADKSVGTNDSDEECDDELDQSFDEDDAQIDNNFRNIILKLHNQDRAKEGLNPLTLNDVCNKHAQGYAEKMAKSGVFKHSTDRVKMGENIAMRYPVTNDAPEKLYKQWQKEQQFFRNKPWPDVTTKKGYEVGHWTQIMWADTTELGVGYATNKKAAYLCCNYRKPGNVRGKKAYN